MFTHVLVPFDGSVQSQHALNAALEMAKGDEPAHVTVLEVAPPMSFDDTTFEVAARMAGVPEVSEAAKDETRKIVDLQLADLRGRMDEGKHLNLDVTTAAKDYIIDSAYDSVYGARPIKRFIQSRVETLIAKAIIQGRYAEGSTLTVDYDGNALVLK